MDLFVSVSIINNISYSKVSHVNKKLWQNKNYIYNNFTNVTICEFCGFDIV